MSDKRILIIAQTPPPFHGQAIMQQYLVQAKWDWCSKDFVRMKFSEQIHEVGRLKAGKVLQLFGLVNRVRRKSNPKFELIYYPPGGPNRIPIYRDIIVLYFLKFFSKKIILHFHAGGINEIFRKTTKIESFLIKKAFQSADAVIVLSDWLKREVEWCKANKIFVVPNGIEDVSERFPRPEKYRKHVSFLFIGNLKKQKGIFTLLKAALILKNSEQEFELSFVGSFHDGDEEKAFWKYIDENNLTDYVQFLGPKTGDEKWEQFKDADVFCLPTYETEGMPISILEAMMFGIPVLTTNWRGIPDMIEHGENGLLFEPDNEIELANCMRRMIYDEQGRKDMGARARKEYLQRFTLEQHLKRMENVFQQMLIMK